MSWSFNRTGMAAVVAVAVAEDVARIKCAEPEEAIKNSIGSIVAIALAAFPADAAVVVAAGGSQSTLADGKLSNSVSLKIEPIYGFMK